MAQSSPEPMEHQMTDAGSQREQIQQDQIVNSAGGFVWKVDDWKRFHRFLVLGSELPTYYIGDKELGKENAKCILRLFEVGRGVDVVNEILEFSLAGRTAKQNPIMLAFAMCARMGDPKTKQRAYEVLPQICHIPTHLFMFVARSKTLSQSGAGWGKAPRKAIQKWYIEKPPMKLAMDVTKYQKREGWSHYDIARVVHLKSDKPSIQCILKYVVKGFKEMLKAFAESDDDEVNEVLNFLKAVEEMKNLTMENEDRVVELIEQQQLVREHIPTVCLGSKKVWNALLQRMPMTAMIRNLNKMTAIGLLDGDNDQVQSVCGKLHSEEQLRKARIHPFNVLLALKQYSSGKGSHKGSLTWKANTKIETALEDAFYLSFKNVESTGKRYMLAMDVSTSVQSGGCEGSPGMQPHIASAVAMDESRSVQSGGCTGSPGMQPHVATAVAMDVSGSMQSGRCNGSPSMQPHVASAAMAMVIARTEEHHTFVAFSEEIVPMGINSDMKLKEVLDELEGIPKDMGGTDCAKPMLYATKKELKIDVFVVYTDCETFVGDMHPSEALKQYRAASGILDAKLIVVGLTSNGFTIADPEDPGMLDMVGFDSAATQAMREFILGNI